MTCREGQSKKEHVYLEYLNQLSITIYAKYANGKKHYCIDYEKYTICWKYIKEKKIQQFQLVSDQIVTRQGWPN